MTSRFSIFHGRAAASFRVLLMVLTALWLTTQPANAKDLLAQEKQWYEPEPMANIDLAASTIASLERFFVFYGGMNIDQVVVTREGLAIHASQTSVRQNSQYVPTYGGAWIGNRYVPYYGGTTVTSAVPVTSELQAYVPFGRISDVGIVYFPHLTLAWGVYLYDPEKTGSVTLRTSDKELARKFANAAVTLIEKANPGFMSGFDPFGLAGGRDDAKAFKKAKYKRSSGYYLTDVARGGPAERAGLRAGDIIMTWNGQELGDRGLRDIVPAMNTDLELVVDLLVFRDKQEIPIRVTARNRALIRSLATNPPRLGINRREVTGTDPLVPGQAVPTGVFVKSVIQTTLAHRMDFRAGDIIIGMNGAPIANGAAMDAILAAGPVRSAKVLREGAVRDLQAPPLPAAAPERLGLGVREIPAADGRPGYLEVATVEPGLAAAKLDFRVGDRILAVNGKTVATTADLTAIFSSGPVVAARVLRAGVEISLGGVTSF